MNSSTRENHQDPATDGAGESDNRPLPATALATLPKISTLPANVYASILASHNNSQTSNRMSIDSGGRASGSSAVSIMSFDKPLPDTYTFEAGGLSPSSSSIRSTERAGGLSSLRGGQLRAGSPAPFHTQRSVSLLAVEYPAPSSMASTFDPNLDEDDDEDRFGIETRRLSPSLREHIVENGRTYHSYKAGRYPWPNDMDEQNRDDLKHYLTMLLCREHYFEAPIENMLRQGGNVLDLGTGIGRWVVEMADIYQDSSFTGIDLSPIQQEDVPVNVQFIVDDIEHEAGWDYPENHFDFIHIRHVLFSMRDRRKVVETAFRHLKPGGWIEIQEFENNPYCDDGTVTDATNYRFRDFTKLVHQGLHALGMPDSAVSLDAQVDLGDIGFVDLFERVIKCPVGNWPVDKRQKLIGKLKRQTLMEGLDSISTRTLTKGLGWTKIQVEMLLVEVRNSLSNPDFHIYFRFQTLYGMKPFPESTA